LGKEKRVTFSLARYHGPSSEKEPMGSFSIWHWLILIMVVALLFGGKGKISGLLGDFAHGIRNFKEGLKDPNDTDKHEAVEAKKTDEVKG
jgi:sec-independent protein translocase protein TatA